MSVEKMELNNLIEEVENTLARYSKSTNKIKVDFDLCIGADFDAAEKLMVIPEASRIKFQLVIEPRTV